MPRRTDIAITMLPGEARLGGDAVDDQVSALGTVLDLAIGDVRIAPAR